MEIDVFLWKNTVHRYLLILILWMTSLDLSAQLTLDRKELSILLNSGIHFQKGNEAPYKNVLGKDLLEFAEDPGVFYRVGLSSEYTVKGMQQLYTDNRAPFHTVGLGFGFVLPKIYNTRWVDSSDPGNQSVLKGKCSSYFIRMSYVIRKNNHKWVFGYGFSGSFYRSNCKPLYAIQEGEAGDDFFKMSQYGISPLALIGYRPARFIFELNAHVQWLWNHNVLGYLKIENETSFPKRVALYSNWYFIFDATVGFRLNKEN